MSKTTGSILKQTILLALVILYMVCSIESSRDRDRNMSNRRRDKPPGATITTGLCEKSAEMKLLCHCTHDHYNRQRVNDVDCFLLHEEFPQSDLAWYSFNSHPNLKHIQITVTQHGYLGYLPIDVFRKQRDLQTLSIQFGNVREIPSFAFSNLTRLHNLTLVRNQIEILNAYAFANHIALTELDLQTNQITTIDRQAFTNLPKLDELTLSHNNLSTLPNEAFANVTNLNKLKLNDNLLIALTRDVFKGLGKLQQLDVSVNNLKSLGDGVFAELWSLQELYLENNSLERISERAFDGLNNLRILNLQNNKISVLENGVFSTVPAVTTLNLNNNALEWLTFTTILPIMDNLVNNTASVLSISENRFICDCRLRWVFDLHNQTKNRDLKHSLERIKCTLEGTTHHVAPENTLNDPRYQIHFETVPHKMNAMNMDVPNDLNMQTNQYNNNGRRQTQSTLTGDQMELMNLSPNLLPCEKVNDPTELPLQHEPVTGPDSWNILKGKLFKSSAVTLKTTNILTGILLAVTIAIHLS